MTAYVMYVGDWDGRIVQGYVTREDMSMSMWVKPPITEAGAYISGTCTLEDRIRGIQRGSLFKYISNPKMFHCSGDNRYQSAQTLDQAMYRSYVIPDVLAGSTEFPEYPWYSVRHSKIVFKIDEIKMPSLKYTFCESEFKNPNFNYDHGGWSFAPWIEPFWRDALGTFHNKSATFAFADGHAEKHKWVHNETWKTFKGDLGMGSLTPTLAANQDIRWCWEHYPYLSNNEKPKLGSGGRGP